MKLKIMNYSQEMVLTVSGELQEIIINKEDGCLILELLEENRAIIAGEKEVILPSVPVLKEEVILPSVPMLKEEINLPTVPVVKEEGKEEDAVVSYYRNNTLFHKLSDLRRTLAIAEKVAPYLIFHDKTLWGMVEKMPEDLHSLGKISGVGKSKLEKYGVTFLSALKEGA